MLLGLLLIVLLTAVPGLGGLLNTISVLLGFGALLLTARRLLQPPTPAVTHEPAPPAADPASIQASLPSEPGSGG